MRRLEKMATKFHSNYSAGDEAASWARERGRLREKMQLERESARAQELLKEKGALQLERESARAQEFVKEKGASPCVGARARTHTHSTCAHCHTV